MNVIVSCKHFFFLSNYSYVVLKTVRAVQSFEKDDNYVWT